MKERTFWWLMGGVLALCLALTAAHLLYAVHAYEHCSIIEFIARELW